MEGKQGVSLKNGYTRIANEMLVKLTQTPFSDIERRFLFAVIRYVYGYQQDSRPIPRRAIMACMGIRSKRLFEQARQSLKEFNIITCIMRKGFVTIYKINRDISSWVTRPQFLYRTHLPYQEMREKVGQPLGTLPNTNQGQRVGSPSYINEGQPYIPKEREKEIKKGIPHKETQKAVPMVGRRDTLAKFLIETEGKERHKEIDIAGMHKDVEAFLNNG